MRKTISFVKLDFLTVKPYLTLKNLFLLVVVCVFVSWGNSSSSMVVGMVMMFGATYVSYPFAVGEQNGIDSLYASLPITHDTVVRGRYLFTIAVNLCAALLAFSTMLFASALFKKAFSLHETLLIVVITFFVFALVQAFQLPIYFKLGYSKAKFVAYIPLFCFPAIVLLLSSALERFNGVEAAMLIFEWIFTHQAASAIICFALVSCGLYFSHLLSLKYYKKREF